MPGRSRSTHQAACVRTRAADPFYGVMLMPRSKILVSSWLVAISTALGAQFAGAQASTPAGAPTEAPAGFDTPSFNAAHNISNGLVEPPGDTFARDQEIFELNKSV